MPELLRTLSGLSTPAICLAAVIHLIAFAVLWVWFRRDLRGMADDLDRFTRGLKHRSVLDGTAHLSDQVEGFLADVRDVLDDPSRSADRTVLLQRMSILDERRRYLHSHFFETAYNVCRTMVEAYPLTGILGTILGIGSALQMKAGGPLSDTTLAIVRFFGDAIWSTFAGLVSALVLMFLNSLLEPSFMRLAENRRQVRELIARAKRELSLSAGGDA